MSSRAWQALLTEPTPFDEHTLPGWFDAIAERLLCGCRLMVAGEAHRLTEIEMYYHGGWHLDPFSHRDPVTKATGPWYFHRTHGVYRGGSFKGVDLTFGGTEAFGGILIRGVEREDGVLVDGPSLLVDYLLGRSGKATVALPAGLGQRQSAPLALAERKGRAPDPEDSTSRLITQARGPIRFAGTFSPAEVPLPHRSATDRQGETAHGAGAVRTGHGT